MKIYSQALKDKKGIN